MSEKPDMPLFQQYQAAFAGHIRDPRQIKRPQGVPARRMKVYNELVYNNLEGFLLACFPVLRKVLGQRKWGRLVRDFIAVHRCHTPFFRQIPDEFLQYLNSERGEHPEDPAFLRDLAHYEWVELMLSVSCKEIDHACIDPEGNLLDAQPALSPLLTLQSYDYPVHRIGPAFKPTPEQQEATHFAIVRNADGEVKFILLNPVSLQLLLLLQSQALTGREALLQIAVELNHPAPEAVVAGGLDIMKSFMSAQIILGTRKHLS